MFKRLVEFVRLPRVAVALFILGAGSIVGGLALRPHVGSLVLFVLGLDIFGVALYGAFTSDRLS